MALDLDQGGELLGGLDALAGASDAEGICQRHDRVDDRAAFGVAVEALDETPIDLEDVQRQLAEAAQ
jgi:hypothetical protein